MQESKDGVMLPQAKETPELLDRRDKKDPSLEESE